MLVYIANTCCFLVATGKFHRCPQSHNRSHNIGRTQVCLCTTDKIEAFNSPPFKLKFYLTPPLTLTSLLLILGEEMSLLMLKAYLVSWALVPPLPLWLLWPLLFHSGKSIYYLTHYSLSLLSVCHRNSSWLFLVQS